MPLFYRPTWNATLGVRVFLWVAATTLVLLFDLAQRPAQPGPALATLPDVQWKGHPVKAESLKLAAQGDVPMPPGTTAAHASSLVVMPPGDPAALTLFWFSGERESGPLVQIAASQWDRATQRWLEPRFVVNRHVAGVALGFGVRRLGNPVAWTDAQGRMHLWVVATGWGGWAASRVLHLRQSSESHALNALTFEPVGNLPLSWLWNTSFLVRNAPLPLQDGGMALPVHFELGSKISSIARIGPDGAFRGVTRISQRNHVLQPSLIATSATSWVALMRDTRPNGKIVVSMTNGNTSSWIDLPDLAMDNPDAAVAALGLGVGSYLLAYNPLTGGRYELDLAGSANGLDWKNIAPIRQGAGKDEFSYPALVFADDSLWIVYTVDRARLAWQRLAPVGPKDGKQ